MHRTSIIAVSAARHCPQAQSSTINTTTTSKTLPQMRGSRQQQRQHEHCLYYYYYYYYYLNYKTTAAQDATDQRRYYTYCMTYARADLHHYSWLLSCCCCSSFTNACLRTYTHRCRTLLSLALLFSYVSLPAQYQTLLSLPDFLRASCRRCLYVAAFIHTFLPLALYADNTCIQLHLPTTITSFSSRVQSCSSCIRALILLTTAYFYRALFLTPLL